MRTAWRFLFFLVAAHSLAIDIHVAAVAKHPSPMFEMERKYVFTTAGQPDDRFSFGAAQYEVAGPFRGHWQLQIVARE